MVGGGGKRERRAEQKFGVKTQFPNLSLHSAAASGNVGLVKFALTNGQPATSILNGVQPIHAACSGGNKACVRLLLEYGADVNAPRLPRRYNSDKKAAVSVGTSGSTPLHFAAANGHLQIVELLLSCGGRPDLTEKRGLTPEDLARENGHTAVCEALQKWDRQVASAEGVKRHLAEGSRSASRSRLPPPDLPAGAMSPSISSSSAAGNYVARMLSPEPSATSSSVDNEAYAPSLSGTTTPDTNSYARPTATYNSLTFEPSKSSTSLSSHGSSRRRPSLPSVIEKAAHPGAALKQAIGNLSHGPTAKPPPLKLAASTSDAFPHETAQPRARRPSVGSSAKSSIASVFGKRSSTASITSPSIGSPDEQEEDRAFGIQDDHRRFQSEGDSTRSPTLAQLAREAEDERPATAPSTQTTFPATAIEAPPATATAAVQPTSINPAAYRPRKSSLMSTAGSIEQALEHGLSSDAPLPAPAAPWHTRSPSSGSGSATSSIYSFGPGAAQAAASRAALELSSPPLQPEDDYSSQHSSPPQTSEAPNQATLSAEEERDSFATLHPNTLFRPRSNSRLRADSTGSNSSTASHLSPYAVHMHSPLGSQASINDKMPPPPPPPPMRQDSTDSRPSLSLYTRPRRSGSGSTEADLRHIVLSSTNATATSPTSPTSMSSWSGSNYLGSSAASTRATSEGHPVVSVRDPPASPRKLYRSDITPEQAHSMVREAERSLLQYNAREGASQPSLSEQLAQYGDRVSLEREVNRRERQKLASQPGQREKKFLWERLDHDGHHSPLAPSDGDGRSIAGKSTSVRRFDPYQQGNLDVRRPEAPTLRRPDSATSRSHASSSRLEIPPAVDPRLALRSNVHKIYDHRAAALTSQRPPRTPLQYTILESNQPPSSITPPGRRSPSNSVDDPVRPSHAAMSSTTSSTSSPAASVLNMRPSRSRLAGAGPQSNATIKSRQSSGGAATGGGRASSHSSPTRAPAHLEEPRPVQLATPTAPRKQYEPVSGFEGLNMSDQPKGFFAKGFSRIRQGLQ